MTKPLLKSILCLLAFLFLDIAQVAATHLRAGQITAVRIDPNSLTYRIILTLYRDTGGVELAGNANIEIQGFAPFSIPLQNRRIVSGDIEEGRYIGTYTFPGAGTYRIGFRESFRNGCVRNMSNPLSTDLFVETEIVVNPFLGRNSTPVLLALPVDNAARGQQFLHNPGAYDPDGDSLSYSLVTPKKAFGTDVDGFRSLDQFLGAAEEGGAPFFGIDPVTGTLRWDTPLEVGCYNIAIRVTEWRRNAQGNFIYLGFVVRDMQIIVGNFANRRPRLTIPNRICVEVGQPINAIITASDPDNHQIRLEAISQLFDDTFPNPKATVSPDGTNFQPSPAAVNFQWTPSCEHIRERPYQVIFKATDNPPAAAGQPLVDIQVWEIQVVGPAPQNLQASTDNVNNRISLSWDPYLCAPLTESIVIWRRESCSNMAVMNCDVGAPDGQGYVEIGRVPATATSFVDVTARTGLVYSYRVSAVFPAPTRGESVASEQACIALEVDTPLFTKVDVLETSTTSGRVEVAFIQPFQFSLGAPSGPYGYAVFRSEGLDGNIYTEVFSAYNVPPTQKAPITFIDENLNTAERDYNYRIAFYSNASSSLSRTFRDSSDKASTVRLRLLPSTNCINLEWRYNVPWSNQFQPHDIFRSVGGEPDAPAIGTTTLVGRSFGSFTDENGIVQNTIYSYRVLARGSYFNQAIVDYYNQAPAFSFDFATLPNHSQISSAAPEDNIKPCPPQLSVAALDCDSFDFSLEPPFSNTLQWVNAQNSGGSANGGCGELGDECEFEEANIALYRIYYKPNVDAAYVQIAEVTGMNRNFLHDNLDSFAGCYVVTAVDNSGNESEFSNEVCVDNCVRYVLPNVFTPNGDSVNDLFRAFSPVNFVEDVDFEVVNRFGQVVYKRNNDIFINWNGRSDLASNSEGSGNALPAGVYYYTARVRFKRVDPRTAVQTFKGWIHIIK